MLIDKNSNGRVDEVRKIADNLDLPNGVVWQAGRLFVMTATLLLRYDDVDSLVMAGKVRRCACCRSRVWSAVAVMHSKLLALVVNPGSTPIKRLGV